MDNSPRKASDIILSLEHKIDQLMKTNISLDLNIKILSNKLNEVIKVMGSGGAVSPPPPSSMPSASAFVEENTSQFQDPKSIPVKQELAIPITNAPSGFRRTSRPETYAPAQSNEPPTIVIPPNAMQTTPEARVEGNKVAASQRIIDKNGKAIFLANVEITNVDTRQVEYRTRTSGVGKWSASLPVGKYQVVIKKSESATKQQLEQTQNLTIDGSNSTIDLPILIMK